MPELTVQEEWDDPKKYSYVQELISFLLEQITSYR
jgi:hypothetical protein